MTQGANSNGDRPIASRLRRGRGRSTEEAASTPATEMDEAAQADVPAETPPQQSAAPSEFDFGYGGWSVTLQSLAMPEPARQSANLTERPALPAPSEPDGSEVDASGRLAIAPPDPRPDDRPLISPERPRGRLAKARRETGETRSARAVRSRKGGDDGARNRRARRIEGGGTVIIEGALYPLVDWSAGGIAIASKEQLYRVGDTHKLELEIDLGDYAVNLDLDAEVVNRDSDKTGWRFNDPSDTQRQVLRSLTHAAVSAQSFNAPRQRAGTGMPKATAERPRRRRGKGLSAVLSLPFNAGMAAVIAGIVIVAMDLRAPQEAAVPAVEEPTVVRADHAAVAVARFALAAPVGGVVGQWQVAPDALVSQGDALVVVTDAGGQAETLESPCDCFLARALAEPGQTVTEGQDIALLYGQGAVGHIQALFDAQGAPNPGDQVAVDLPYSGQTYAGVVERVGDPERPDAFIGLPSAILRGNADAVFARIRTTPGLPAALAGDPAIVTLARQPDA
ncbi:MAG: PilZ domain-containing protein [Pseudomonadota bacterium]